MPRCLDVFVSIRTTQYHRLNHSIAKPQVQPFRTKSKTWDMPSSTMSRSIRVSRISKKSSPSSSRIYETLSNKDQNAALFLLSVPANHEDNVCYTLMALLAAHSQAPPGGVNTLGFSSSRRYDINNLQASRATITKMSDDEFCFSNPVNYSSEWNRLLPVLHSDPAFTQRECGYPVPWSMVDYPPQLNNNSQMAGCTLVKKGLPFGLYSKFCSRGTAWDSIYSTCEQGYCT